ncbi:MAG: polyprenol monophosphomannose synthase [Actinomycetota bacterium]|nr:polyprenol monophosphomannose synthase [Actinomycetota bacterium]MDA3020128.1 polyprenol monophosphomannose synthase [Actinomycetota bacterium]
MLVAVVLPTYNESENIARFLTQLRKVLPDGRLYVVDDNSPDGTGEIAERCAAELGGIEVIHRPGKQGLGSAYRQGFAHVISQGVDVVVSMDVDFSHDPLVIPAMLAAIESGSDAVIGSRYVTGGGTKNWPLHRRLLSRWGNLYTASVLGVRVRDCTSGFRAYRATALASIAPETTKAEGYAFLSELVVRLSRRGLKISEVPILFVDRENGTSKMSGRIIVESMLLVTRWGIVHRWNQAKKFVQTKFRERKN